MAELNDLKNALSDGDGDEDVLDAVESTEEAEVDDVDGQEEEIQDEGEDQWAADDEPTVCIDGEDVPLADAFMDDFLSRVNEASSALSRGTEAVEILRNKNLDELYTAFQSENGISKMVNVPETARDRWFGMLEDARAAVDMLADDTISWLQGREVDYGMHVEEAVGRVSVKDVAIQVRRTTKSNQLKMRVGEVMYPEAAIHPMLLELARNGWLELDKLVLGDADGALFTVESDDKAATLTRVLTDCVHPRPAAPRMVMESVLSKLRTMELAASDRIDVFLESGGLLAKKDDEAEGGYWLQQYTFNDGQIRLTKAAYDDDGAMVGNVEAEPVSLLDFCEALFSLRSQGWAMKIMDNTRAKHDDGMIEYRVVKVLVDGEPQTISTAKALGELIKARVDASYINELEAEVTAVLEIRKEIDEFHKTVAESRFGARLRSLTEKLPSFDWDNVPAQGDDDDDEEDGDELPRRSNRPGRESTAWKDQLAEWRRTKKSKERRPHGESRRRSLLG